MTNTVVANGSCSFVWHATRDEQGCKNSGKNIETLRKRIFLCLENRPELHKGLSAAVLMFPPRREASVL